MPGKFEIKECSDGQVMFNLKAGNGQVILTSERYTKKAGAKSGITSVRKNCANDARFEHRVAKNNKPYFVLKARNGEEIGRSQMYASAASMAKGIASVKNNAPDCPVVDLA